MQEIYEKLGLFYLGKDVDKEDMSKTDVLTLLKNKNFTTHAAIIGMTGSGKTGLGIGIIEEAIIDNIPSIIIDPKGDMGNLCLTDPEFNPKSFEPWIKDEAISKDKDLSSYAKEVASFWKDGIESSDQNMSRVEKIHRVEKSIYTPGSTSGIPINIMSSLGVPPLEIMQDSDTLSSYLKSTTTSLFSLIGMSVDPIDSKEYILLAQIILKSWLREEDLNIENIIGKIIKPSFKKIGVLSLDDYYPKEERFKLATKFNALLSSPSFSLWLEGDDLDIQSLLYDENGKAKIAIFSISHLNDDERMFFVTLLLNKYIAWMRRQSGSSTLKTILYMDEIFGFFPPTKNPPSKEPMLLLLKQARAFGVGIVLSTQNPVDLDYKGLSNIGTWFIGRLQTRQDVDRVIDGLEGKIGSNFNKSEIRNILSNLKKRTFFLKSAHLDDIRLFGTRWVMSYLKGPLKREEISSLMSSKKAALSSASKDEKHIKDRSSIFDSFQDVDESIPQFYEMDLSSKNRYTATLSAYGKVYFYQARKGIDTKREFELHIELDSKDNHISWTDAMEDKLSFYEFSTVSPTAATFASLPESILKDKGLKSSIRELKDMLYYQCHLELFRCKSLKLESKLDETRRDFTVRVNDNLANKKEIEIEKIKDRYSKKETTLTRRLDRARDRLEKEASDSRGSMIDAGIAVLGALFGKSSSAKIGRAVSKGSKILKERGEMSRAEERVFKVEEDMEILTEELEDKIDDININFSIDDIVIETFKVKPRKTDIDVKLCAVVWRAN